MSEKEKINVQIFMSVRFSKIFTYVIHRKKKLIILFFIDNTS